MGKAYQLVVRKPKPAGDPSYTLCPILLSSKLAQEEIASFRIVQVLCSPSRWGRSGSTAAMAGWFLFVFFQIDTENFLPSLLPTKIRMCPIDLYTQPTDIAPELSWKDPYMKTFVFPIQN